MRTRITKHQASRTENPSVQRQCLVTRGRRRLISGGRRRSVTSAGLVMIQIAIVVRKSRPDGRRTMDRASMVLKCIRTNKLRSAFSSGPELSSNSKLALSANDKEDSSNV